LIEEKGLNLIDTYALCRKVFLGKNVVDLFEGKDFRQFKKEVVQHTKTFMFLKWELMDASKLLFEINGIGSRRI
jgi:hypothetical protein